MTRYIVDASVAVKWVVPEIHSVAAGRLLAARHELFAPELLLAEITNVLWKKHRLKELAENEVLDIMKDLRRFPLQVLGMMPYIETALELALRHRCSVYDCIYLALGLHHTMACVTADRKLFNALGRGKSGLNIVWVEDL